MMKKSLYLLIGAFCANQAWAAPDVSSIIDAKIKKEINEILHSEVVVESIRAQNARYANLSQDKVEALDDLWRKQRESDEQYLIAATLSNPLSTYFTRIQALAGGKFLEIFAMDNKGLNVGQSAISSDYWQGDEGKWQKTYLKGPKAVFVDSPEYYADKGIWGVQYNAAVSDEQGNAIGAVTFELNLTELARLQDINK